ncbi:MAG: PmoA family protein [Planctomycetota bacterium]|nr:hypothetical protein [Planctomycetota bacterium]MDP6838845.1 PmoA family protein [Planctomycetota bacterium]
MHNFLANLLFGLASAPSRGAALACAALLAAACSDSRILPPTPAGSTGSAAAAGAIAVHLSETSTDPEFNQLQNAFARSNPGYDISWLPGVIECETHVSPQLFFIQAGEGTVSLAKSDSGAVTHYDYSVGDLLPIRPGHKLQFDPPADLLGFTVPEELPGDLPPSIRPDWDPAITDTPGGCATESGAYRRILLTWRHEVGPFVFHALNAHRVRVQDSFTHYHPREGGFDELYLVQEAQTGARLLVGDDLAPFLDPEGVTAAQASSMLREIPVRKGDLIYLPRGVVHRGLGGILAQVISVPGFVPDSELAVDDQLRSINERLGLTGAAALPVHSSARPGQQAPAAPPRVELERLPDRLRFTVNGELFTEYRLTGRFPAFFPVRNPAGQDMTRAFPFEERANENQDHPHHRSLWFAHGDMNGVDFWHDESTVINQRRLLDSGSDGERAFFTGANTWVDGKGRLICTDERRVTAFAQGTAWGLDFDITLTASGAGLVIGDTKEGTCAIRLAPGLVADEGARLINSAGQEGSAVWGQRSPWLLTTGTLAGKKAAVAILDHPDNPRYPTTWHARTYGLLAANPFGLSAFDKQPTGAGALRLKAGESVRFQYRFLFFEGHPEAAHIGR